MAKFGKNYVLRLAALGALTIGLSGCYYETGLGYYDQGYSNYDCDPYSPFESYYDCDYGYGFNNVGFGGGWYEQLWYPGYGLFVFDNYGRRYYMRDHHRRYWGERRHAWYREHHRRGRNGGHGHGYVHPGGDHDSGHWGNANGGHNDHRRDRRNRGMYQGDQANPAVGTPSAPTVDGNPGRNRGGLGLGNHDGRGEGRRREGRRDVSGLFGGQGRQNNARQGTPDVQGAPAATPAPQPRFRSQGNGGQGRGLGSQPRNIPQPQPRNDAPASRPSRENPNARPD